MSALEVDFRKIDFVWLDDASDPWMAWSPKATSAREEPVLVETDEGDILEVHLESAHRAEFFKFLSN